MEASITTKIEKIVFSTLANSEVDIFADRVMDCEVTSAGTIMVVFV